MQLQANIMFFSPDLTQFIFESPLSLLYQPRFLEIRHQWIGRRSVVQVVQEPVDIVPANAQVFDLRFEKADVI